MNPQWVKKKKLVQELKIHKLLESQRVKSFFLQNLKTNLVLFGFWTVAFAQRSNLKTSPWVGVNILHYFLSLSKQNI